MDCTAPAIQNRSHLAAAFECMAGFFGCRVLWRHSGYAKPIGPKFFRDFVRYFTILAVGGAAAAARRVHGALAIACRPARRTRRDSQNGPACLR
ncbi:MAG: hypothetical protein KGL42_08520, partial [Betaproteobacteria bacterium]|nr:hypothetical protein [Betaproteobacteria bacterium]